MEKDELKALYARVGEYKAVKIWLTSLDASTKRCMVQFHGIDICIDKDVLLKEVCERIDEYHKLIEDAS